KIIVTGTADNAWDSKNSATPNNKEYLLARYLGQGPASAELSGLTLQTSSNGSTFAGTVALSPAFLLSTTAYTATLDGAVTHVKFTPTAVDGLAATVTVTPTSGAAQTVTSGSASTAVDVSAVTPSASLAVAVTVTGSDGSTMTYTVTLMRLPPVLTLTTDAPMDTIGEGGGTVTVTATLDRVLMSDVSVQLSATSASSATATSDYTLPGAFTIPAGQTSATGTVTIVSDDDAEGQEPETVVLTTTVTDVTVVPVTLNIRDDDVAGIRVSRQTLTVFENLTTTYTVRLNTAPSADVIITVTSGTPATATVSPAMLTFTSADWQALQTVTVTGVDAGVSTVTHAASGSDTDYPATLSLDSVTVTVSESTKTYLIDPSWTVSEATRGSVARLQLTLGQPAPAGGLTLKLAYGFDDPNFVPGPGLASAADLRMLPRTLKVAEGDNTATQQIEINIDEFVEGDETFTVTVSSDAVGWAAVLGQDTATVTIADDDTAAAKIAFQSDERETLYTRTASGGGYIELPIHVSLKPATATEFTVEVLSSGTAVEYVDDQNPGDFRIQHKTVTFGPDTLRFQQLCVTVHPNTNSPKTIELRIAAADSPVDDLGDHYSRHPMGSLATVTIDPGSGTATCANRTPPSTMTPTGGPGGPSGPVDPGGPVTDDGDPDDTDDGDPDIDDGDPDIDGGDPDDTDDGDPDDTDDETSDNGTEADETSDDETNDDGTEADETSDDGTSDDDGGGARNPPVRIAECELDHTVTESPFVDVAEFSFAYNDVACIFTLGVTTGTSNTTYSPKDPVTREQMAAFLARLYASLNGAPAESATTPFTDIADSFASQDVGRIYGLGITTGTSNTTYSPNDKVTREQMAAFLARLYASLNGTPAESATTPFTDIADSFASQDVGRIYGLGITTGTSNTTYSPKDPVTREQMAAFLARFYRVLTTPNS
ncbi:MAG: S-layer homology domain-containing protein, partial [Acidimicrobiaceae bacterium]|nr:S-layer homology domain-containing protein [Acidimicrobiaceae bacterium]